MTKLDLFRNEIGDAGALAIAEALGFNTTLTRLHLDENEIGDEGEQAIADAVTSNLCLVTVSWPSTPHIDSVVGRNRTLFGARRRQVLALFSAIDDPSTLLYHGYDVFKDLSRSIKRGLLAGQHDRL